MTDTLLFVLHPWKIRFRELCGVWIFCLLVILLTGCSQENKSDSPKQKVITESDVYRITGNRLVELVRDTSRYFIRVEPDHAFNLDSIRQPKVFSTFCIGDTARFFFLSQGRLPGKTFWRSLAEHKEMTIDGTFEFYIDAYSGRVLFTLPTDAM